MRFSSSLIRTAYEGKIELPGLVPIDIENEVAINWLIPTLPERRFANNPELMFTEEVKRYRSFEKVGQAAIDAMQEFQRSGLRQELLKSGVSPEDDEDNIALRLISESVTRKLSSHFDKFPTTAYDCIQPFDGNGKFMPSVLAEGHFDQVIPAITAERGPQHLHGIVVPNEKCISFLLADHALTDSKLPTHQTRLLVDIS